MSRNILLVEPRYPTKFPPLGLMKISAYHKLLGDRVTFVKGYNADIPYEYWDRIYITTLFTYHWKMTIEDILFYKNMLHGETGDRIFVGGIMASLMEEEVWRATGIRPVTGLLCEPGAFGDDNDYVIEDMIPDYKLFDGTNADYMLLDSYFGYMTRGCVWKCKFCGVWLLEPEFVEYRGLKPYVAKIEELYGQKQDLVLFDNNILASKKFKQVIKDIRDLGFEKGAKLKDRKRHVDFNQGTDARLMKEWHFELLGKIAISPLRIAFDHIKYEKIYRNNIRLAAEYEIENLSNYILYNYEDTPEELWQRLKINIDLNKKHRLKIYSFPMKFIPINAKDRTFIDEPRWNWYFIRSVQRILNVTKGVVMTGEEFFHRAFGADLEEFRRILHMPERILMNRGWTPGPEEEDWISKFEKLSDNEKSELLQILNNHRTRATLKRAISKNKNRKLDQILDYYLPPEKESDTPTLFGAESYKGFSSYGQKS